MGEIIKFEVGCRGCKNLIRLGKQTYICGTRVHLDDSTITPIIDGIKTYDWGICDGEGYEREDERVYT